MVSPPAPRGRAAARQRPRPGTRAGSRRKRTARGSRCRCCKRGPRGGAGALSAGPRAGRAGGGRGGAPASWARGSELEIYRRTERTEGRVASAQRAESAAAAHRRLYWPSRPRGPASIPPPPTCSRAPPAGPSWQRTRLVGRWGVKSSEHTPPVAGDLRDRCDFTKGGRFCFVRVPIDEKKG